MPVRILPSFRPVQSDRFQVGGPLSGQFLYGHGHLFFPVRDRGVLIRGVLDGRRPIMVPMPDRIQAVALSDEALLISGKGGLQAVSLLPLLTEGELEMQTLLTDPVAEGYGPTLLVVEGSGLAVVAARETVHAFALGQDGHTAWTCPREGMGALMLLHTGGLIVAVEQTGQVWAIDPANGEVRWRIRLPEEVNVRATMTAHDGRLYLLTYPSNRLWLILVEHGRQMQMAATMPDVKGMTCSGSLLIVAGMDGVYRISAVEPDPACVSEQPFSAAPLMTEGMLVGGASSGALIMMDPRAHFPRDLSVSGADDLVLTTPLVVGERIFLAAQNGEVVVFQNQRGGEAT